jgi:predicted Zn-dependent protease
LTKDLAADRIKLVYEYNKESPLFARVASIEIEQGKIIDAVKILNEGIAKHPNYPTAFLILALAKAYEGKEEDARETARTTCDFINSPKTYEYYVTKIAEIIAERNSINNTARARFIEDSKHNEQTELFEDKLDDLAKELIQAKIVPKENVIEVKERKGKRLLSETLADIHFAQKNYDEAISMYEELINHKPEKAEFYFQKIAKIKNASEPKNPE